MRGIRTKKESAGRKRVSWFNTGVIIIEKICMNS